MITKYDAQHATQFEHMLLRNADGTPARCRATGKCRIWVHKPDDFKLPVKHGWTTSFYLTPANATEWRVV